MSGHVRRARRCITLAVGVTGVVVAHVGAYAVAFSDPHQRAHVLASTGHGYWSIAVWAALLSAAVAVAAMAARGALCGVGSCDGVEGRVVPGFGSLAGVQTVMFASVEVIERLGAGARLDELVHGHELQVGLLLQVVVAALVVVALGAVERFCARIAGALSHARRPSRARVTSHAWILTPRGSVMPRRPRPRAPPTAARLCH